MRHLPDTGMGEPRRAPADNEGGRTTEGSHRHPRTLPADRGEWIDLPITGMPCAACFSRIEHTLQASPGVRRAAVDVATSRVVVEYDPAVTDMRTLLDKVEKVGFWVARPRAGVFQGGMNPPRR